MAKFVPTPEIDTMIEAANAADADPWFTLDEHDADEEWCAGFQSHLAARLRPSLTAYVEWNEGWNLGYSRQILDMRLGGEASC